MKFFSKFSQPFLALAAAAMMIASCKDDEEPPIIDEENVVTISAIDPTNGPVGTEVEIRGSNFGDELTDHIIEFNGTEAEITSVNDSRIIVIVPENAGSGAVSLRTGGKTITGPEFTVTEPETGISTIRPANGAAGMTVKINGSGFGDELTDHVVSFNGTEAEITEVSNAMITVVVPEGVTTGPVTLNMGGQTYEGPVFTVLEENIALNEGFSNDDGISAIGQAFIYNDESVEGVSALRLTPASANRVGVAYYGTRIPVEEGFETTFEFRISRPGRPEGQTGEIGAEGFAFVIHNDPRGLEARGHVGGSIGYAGIENGIAVEFDTYNNQEGEHHVLDPSGNHISVQTNLSQDNRFGKIGAEIYHSLGHTSTDIPEFIGNETEKHKARIVYNPGLLQIYVNDRESPSLEVELTLTDYMNLVDGKAYVGFTAATGVTWGWAAHDILNWTLSPNTEADNE